MARRPRLFGEEIYHHIYAWGNNRQAIFLVDQHYERYISLLEKYSNNNQIDTIAYALMQSHIHLFLYDHLGKVSQFMNSLHGEYAQYYNHMIGRVGHVFGERFNNKVVQANEYGLWLSRYIHRQAVEAGIVTAPRQYPWTSYQIYIGAAPLGFLKPDVILEQFGDKQGRRSRYEEFVEGTENGPIDWNLKSMVVIGNEDFNREVQVRLAPEVRENLSEKQIYELVTTRFKIKHGLLLNPHGWEEKRTRCEVIKFLVEEVGLQAAKIAQLCRISKMTVHRALHKNVKNVMPVPGFTKNVKNVMPVPGFTKSRHRFQ
ncbi:MAG: transposase [candidate division WOR-3 bacterium]|nr:MAG: transposase [candidate division WOR-3 bacterium]